MTLYGRRGEGEESAVRDIFGLVYLPQNIASHIGLFWELSGAQSIYQDNP
jgi:hypothetical protein